MVWFDCDVCYVFYQFIVVGMQWMIDQKVVCQWFVVCMYYQDWVVECCCCFYQCLFQFMEVVVYVWLVEMQLCEVFCVFIVFELWIVFENYYYCVCFVLFCIFGCVVDLEVVCDDVIFEFVVVVVCC